jgi:3-mercaptopyruvate sulfurtransferase SseA
MSTKVPLGVKDVENVPVKIMESKATHTVSKMDKRPASEDHVMKLEKEVSCSCSSGSRVS